MDSLQIAIKLKNEYRHYFLPDSSGKSKSLLQISETIEDMTNELRAFVESQKPKPEIETVETFMRKSENRARKNRPPADTNKITVKQTPKEKEEANESLEVAKAIQKKVVRLPQGFSYGWEKEKSEFKKRKAKNEAQISV